MADSDALIVVGDWISEHYFTTDATKESYLARVLERAKEWKKADYETPRSRFTQARTGLATALADIFADQTPDLESGHHAHAELRRILGYDDQAAFIPQANGPLTLLRRPGQTDALAIVEAAPADALEELFARRAQTLATLFETDDGETIDSASKLLSHVFQNEPDVAFALIIAGRWLVVAEESRWPEGRYLAVDIQTVAERADLKQGGEVDRALVALAAESLAPDADGETWWAKTLEQSVAHSVGVSADLREGVRHSIEIIANEVVDRRRSRGLDPLPQSQAQPLAIQSLRFLYRILFLLYAEASPEFGILPVGDPDYARGYSLDRLRELIQTELATPNARAGTHIYTSLKRLFELVDRGHRLHIDEELDGRGLEFHPLRADLFKPEATALIDEVGLGNRALQEVLGRLLLSKETRGKERGFISYVDLGINQLGAVYEGLMSYTGSFAEVDLYEVAKNGDTSKGSWVVPVDRADHLDAADFVTDTDPLTGKTSRRRYTAGQFVFRLSGRERQRSASYYTPEVLTKFTVSQALEELLDQDGHTTTSGEILGLSVCEPALGSGAFAIEAVRQLAEEYLARRQRELGERIDPERYPEELQKVKAYIALHNVYGVDLNGTAVEFAEITLWLDTMSRGLDAPWFGLRLRQGNSLVGASRFFYTREQVDSKAWLKSPPTAQPLTDIANAVAKDEPALAGTGGRIHHWLLPADGWGATSAAKEAARLAPERVKAVKDWRKTIKAKPTKRQLDRLVAISHQADELWQLAYKRLVTAEKESRRNIRLWGRDLAEQQAAAVTREQIEESLADPNGAYRRLRRVMDAWCALWFWPLTGDEVQPPSLEDWITAGEQILGTRVEAKQRHQMKEAEVLAPADAWQALADHESFVLAGADAKDVQDVIEDHPWLAVCEQVAEQQSFFHWQLDFAPVFGRGGFDLQVGNPPWVRPILDVDSLLADGDPWWTLANKPSEEQREARREQTERLPGVVDGVVVGAAETVALGTFVGDITTYPILQGLQPDLYRCFMSQTWAHASGRGTIGLLHPESHFTDEKAGLLREASYVRLRRHWQFVNELQLFVEIHDLVTYGVHTYGAEGDIRFLNASALYHPETVTGSLRHSGEGEEPGFKHEGKWDRRPHRYRIQAVTVDVLALWRSILEDQSVPIRQTRMLYTVNRTSRDILARLAKRPRIASLGLSFSSGWHEKSDRTKGRFIQKWGRVDSWDDAILQGPHLHVGNPFYKSPNSTMKHNQDWSDVDLEALAPDELPITSYKPAGDLATYDAAYGTWNGTPVRDHYRLAWRRMAANGGERTLISALLPPGPAHVNAVFTAGGVDPRDLALAAAVSQSLLSDFQVRSVPKGDVYTSTFERLALPPSAHPLVPRLLLRTLRLNCLTDAYADLWRACWDPAFTEDEWLLGKAYPDAPSLGDVGPEWTPDVPLRRDVDRRNALVEIDALMAVMLGVSADELATIYRTNFAVLYGYDQDTYIFDANGRIVPNSVLTTWRKKGATLTEEERTATHPGSGIAYTYELPFAPRDRESDFHTTIHSLKSHEVEMTR